MSRKQKKMLLRIIATALLLAALQLLPAAGLSRLLAALGIYLLIGYDILLKSARSMVHGVVMDENFLMSIASLGAFALGAYGQEGDYNEAVAVLLFYQVGELFQSCAVAKSRRSIAALMDIRPDSARVESAEGLRTLPPEEVGVGSVIVVHPGERVPLDGVVLEGESTLNTSALTGESMPRSIAPAESISSGCINLQGVLRIRTTREYGECTVARILALVEESAGRKSASERFISRFARVYTPLVCAGAALLAVLPPLVMLSMGQAAGWGVWLYRALVFLVISCPCALVISIPLSFFASIGAAGRAGILIKGAQFVESLARARIVAFDKTGTLTRGVFEVVAVHHSTYPEARLMEYAALAELASAHPISRSLQAACRCELRRDRVRDVCEVAGRGVTALVDGHRVAVGNAALMQAQGVRPIECRSVGTVVHIAVDGAYAGHILIADTPKASARESLRQLAALGISRCVMLSGDNARTAQAVGKELGLTEVCSELLPEQKVEQVERLLSAGQGCVVYVGDGVNDAPVLARADVGIAMGAMGQDAAIEAADVVLMHDDPLQIPQAVCLARRCLRTVRQNIALALGVKFACLGLGAVGLANMWLAIFADVGVSVMAIVNAMCCGLRSKN